MTRWVVVGAGAAGCVVAARLAEAGGEVVLLEAGGSVAPAAIREPDFLAAVAEPGWTFPGPFTRGRGLGGSSAVNGMVVTPGDEDPAWPVRVPVEPVTVRELGPVDRALLAAAPDATTVRLTRRDGRRVTAADAYLHDAEVDVRAASEVTAVELVGRRAVGVRTSGDEVIEGDRVVLAAGAIGSPALLLASEIDTPGVGEGLQNHVGLPVTLRLWPGIGDVAETVVIGAALRREDLQVLSMNRLSPDRPGEAMLLATVMAPTGRGRVRRVHGEVVVEHVLSQHDHDRVAAAGELLRRLLRDSAFETIVESFEIGVGPAGVFHPTSTCAAGVVVDERGAVVGYDDLFVADASVFPAIPITNTYLPTLRLADALAQRWLAATSF